MLHVMRIANGSLKTQSAVRSSSGHENGPARELTPANTFTHHDSQPASGPIVVIDRRPLLRECLTHCFRSGREVEVIALNSIDEWVQFADATRASLFVLCLADGGGDATTREIEHLVQVANGVPTAVLAEGEDFARIMSVIGQGVRGYIPMGVSLAVTIAALELVRAGGTFVPASSLMTSRIEPRPVATPPCALAASFTARQIAVLDVLRQGKANKVIAYELAMREGTVKVHVRNIMKKLKARNRTEVAVLANQLLKANPA